MKRTVVAGDAQYPFQYQTGIRLLKKFIETNKPDHVILNGDWADFYKISSFDKDPTRLETLQDEINIIRRFFRALRRLGNFKITWVQGNHEDRLRRYLWKVSPELASLDCLKFDKLMGLKEFKIRYVEDGVWVGKIYVTHGSIVRKHSGYSAKAEFEKNGCSGISNHTHRDGKYTVRTRGGNFAWWENFCMCQLDAEYIKGIANWTQGFSVITQSGGQERVEQIAIINGKYIYGGKLYK